MPPLPSQAIFLSYASQDREAAARICEALRGQGIDVWFDADGGLEHGDAWDAKIRQQIRDCVLFIPIVSASTQARHEGYFRIEWDLAAERARGIASGVPFILPVLVDGTAQAKALVPERFNAVQWSTLPTGLPSPEYVARVVKLWRQRCGAQASGTAEAIPAAAIPAKSHTRLIWMGAAFALLATGFAWHTLARTQRKAPDAVSAAAEARAAEPNSVAVLAFENLSDDKENEYFSDGVSEELLSVLGRIPGIRVAARTSSFFFKGRNTSLPEIGAKLGVANVIEGSVRKAGRTVRIAARMSSTSTGEQIWSDTYTRDLDDVFAVQSELARTIIAQLKGRLGTPVADDEIRSEVKTAERDGTTNPEANRLYLQGNYIRNQYSLDAFRRAVESYRRAVELDPGFVNAWAGLAAAAILVCDYSTVHEDMDYRQLYKQAAAKAVALDPDSVSALLAKFDAHREGFEWRDANAALEKALKIAPNDPGVLAAALKRDYIFGSPDSAVRVGLEALARDPLNSECHVYMAFSLLAVRRSDEALAEFRRLAEFNPDHVWGSGGIAWAYLCKGNLAAASAQIDNIHLDWMKLFIEAQVRWAQGRRDESERALGELAAKDGNEAAYQVAEVYAFRGDSERAFQWLERARVQWDAGLGWIRMDPNFATMRSDPRFRSFLRKLGLADDQLP